MSWEERFLSPPGNIFRVLLSREKEFLFEQHAFAEIHTNIGGIKRSSIDKSQQVCMITGFGYQTCQHHNMQLSQSFPMLMWVPLL